MSATPRLMRQALGGGAAIVLLSLAATADGAGRSTAETVVLAPGAMPRIATVPERYQAYNVEMVEVTGGAFWKPYRAGDADTALYEYRPPINLAEPRLRNLAAALGPAYVRVSGTWANTTYVSETDETGRPPPGFTGVLTPRQWRGVVEFAKAVDADIITSVANGIGTRGPTGVWSGEQAQRLFADTAAAGGRIAAAAFMNEPTMGGEPPGYDAAAYGRDFRAFYAFVRQAAPDMLIIGPDAVGETAGKWGAAFAGAMKLPTRFLLAASQPAALDVFSYHHYGAYSRRCAAFGMQTSAEAALSEDWLWRTDETLAFYRRLRDEFAPGKPLWLSETADAACGGNPWASTFLDTFRYLDQLGRLAREGVKLVAHNTLAGSDYGLLDEKTLAPRPDYWGALLWRRLMGAGVLEAGVPIQPGLHLYAHCLRGAAGGVALLAINNHHRRATALDLPAAAQRYTLTADTPVAAQIRLNGRPLQLQAGDELPELQAPHTAPGPVELAPVSITFFAIAQAGNPGCR